MKIKITSAKQRLRVRANANLKHHVPKVGSHSGAGKKKVVSEVYSGTPLCGTIWILQTAETAKIMVFPFVVW